MILNQILSAILKRNVWRSVLRIWVWILGLKGLIEGLIMFILVLEKVLLLLF